jgi:hypothetical protein
MLHELTLAVIGYDQGLALRNVVLVQQFFDPAGLFFG